MERLSACQLRLLAGFASVAGEAATLGAFAEHCVAGIGRLVPCDLATYNEMNHERARVVALGHPADALFPEAPEVLARHLDEHPLVSHYARTRDGRALMLSDFVSRHALRRTALYNELFRPLGGEYLVAMTLPAPPALVVGIGLFRAARAFSERDRAALDFLRPLLATAYQAVAARSALQAVEQVAAGEGRGVVLVGRAGAVLHETELAADLLERHFPGRRRGLPDAVARWLDEPRLPLELPRNGDRLVISLAGSRDGELVLLLEEPPRARPLGADALTGLPLSGREREVLALAARGGTNAAIARELRISQRTVKKHLERVYEKLGVGTRTAAAAIAHAEAAERRGGRA